MHHLRLYDTDLIGELNVLDRNKKTCPSACGLIFSETIYTILMKFVTDIFTFKGTNEFENNEKALDSSIFSFC